MTDQLISLAMSGSSENEGNSSKASDELWHWIEFSAIGMTAIQSYLLKL